MADLRHSCGDQAEPLQSVHGLTPLVPFGLDDRHELPINGNWYATSLLRDIPLFNHGIEKLSPPR